MNKRPRKCLGFRTPYEVYYSTMLHLAWQFKCIKHPLKLYTNPLKYRNFPGNKNTGTGYWILSTACPKLTFPSLWHSFLQSSFWTVARMLCGKDGKRNDDTEWRIYYLEWHLTVFLTTVIDPSLSLRMTSYRFPHHGSKSFSADIQSNGQTASPIFSLLSLTHSYQLSAIIPFPKD